MFFLVIILSCCQQKKEPLVPLPIYTPPVEAQSKLDLINFFVLLNHGKYAEATVLYGGSYDLLQGYNPSIDPEDKASLLQSACEMNGFACLQLYEATIIDRVSEKDFVYQVSFRNPDGSIFKVGPCCGATEEEMPPVRLFDIHVICNTSDECKILDLPPYVP